MVAVRRELFERIGWLDTWIVGIQYHDGAKQMESPEVYFDRDPDNTFDPNAIAVYTLNGCQIGHLPRYDAAYFSPLIVEGVVALKGQVGKGDRADRLPLTLEIYATSKVSALLTHDERNDWRAIYHNMFITLWMRLGEYSSATLEEFRRRFRPLAHDQALYPKTQFLYRMLKAYIAAIEKQEMERIRGQVMDAVKGMSFGAVTGWPEMTVIALDAKGMPMAQLADKTALKAVSIHCNDRLSEVTHQLPKRCPYPDGAHGAVVLVRGKWFSLDWYAAPECAQVRWYPMILAGLEKAMEEQNSSMDKPGLTSEKVKADILEALGQATYSLRGTEEEGGRRRIDIVTGGQKGIALYRGNTLDYLRLNEGEGDVIYEAPKPGASPPRLQAEK